MPNYKNGCVYLIKHNQDFDNENVYIGSCCNFTRRKCEHKSVCNNPNSRNYDLKLYKTIRENEGWDGWIMIKLHDYPCNDKYELNREERRVIDEYKSNLNISIPTRTNQEWKKIYKENNPDKLKEQSKKYREENPDKVKERQKKYREENTDKLKEIHKKYREENKEKINETIKEYKKNNKEKLKEEGKQYYQKNKEKILEKVECDKCKNIVSKMYLTKHKKTKKCQETDI